MNLTNDGRHALTAVDFAFDYKDVNAANGGVLETVEIPAGSVVMGGFLVIDTAFVGASEIKVGDSGKNDRYADYAGLDVQGVLNLTPTGYLTEKTERLRLTFPINTPTAGKARVHLFYSQTDRADFTQGL